VEQRAWLCRELTDQLGRKCELSVERDARVVGESGERGDRHRDGDDCASVRAAGRFVVESDAPEHHVGEHVGTGLLECEVWVTVGALLGKS
jgi:hypothetical protein